MTGYRFYITADIAQDRIWQDTAGTWGEKQAEAYIVGLHRHLGRLSRQKSLWRRLPRTLVALEDLKLTVWFNRYEHHYIIFRELSDGQIGVVSILHERMDLPVRLGEDLLYLSLRDMDES